MTMARPFVPIEEITRRIEQLPLPEVDAVVAIERGGVAAGEIAAELLDRPISRLRLSYRDDENTPMFDHPRVIGDPGIPVPAGRHLLVVDDVSVSGATLRRAAEVLGEFSISTLVLKGTADFVAFPEIAGCVTWPWTSGGPAQPDSHSG